MNGPIRAVLFDYGETLVRDWPSVGKSRPEPGVHATLRRLAPDYRLAIAALDGTPADAVREDLARLGLAGLIATVCSAAGTTPPSPTAAVERALAELGVGPAEAVLITGREPATAFPGLRQLHYGSGHFWGDRLRKKMGFRDPLLTSFDDLPATLARLATGEPGPRSWQSAARLGGLLLGFALGTATVLYLWQREEADLGAAGAERTDSNDSRSNQP
ncbi:MAG: hypothetical protein M5U01_10505 [Ardenticatenaceae bacterium]|nr:hypothetical protein [Ardenticatenaceae bacterium]HBY92540.1 hypothetical protein [Chloroflexota bacterium]